MLGLGRNISRGRRGRLVAQVITGTFPSLAPLTDGDTLSSAVTWGGPYTSSASANPPTVIKQMHVDGGTWVAYNGTTVVATSATYAIREVVTDDTVDANTRTFTSGTVTVQAVQIAPTASTAPTISGFVAEGETVTINNGTYAGTTPITVTGVLTLNGADVSGDMVGSNYTIPAGTATQTLAWNETASNGITPNATQSVSDTVVAGAEPTFEITSFVVGPQDGAGDLPITIEATADRTTPYTAYIVAEPTGAAIPTFTQVMAGQDSNGDPAVVVESFAFSTATTTTLTGAISGLSGTYDFYAVVKDGDNENSAVASAGGIVLTSGAEITSIIGSTNGIVVEHTGTLTITGRTDGILLEEA